MWRSVGSACFVGKVLGGLALEVLAGTVPRSSAPARTSATAPNGERPTVYGLCEHRPHQGGLAVGRDGVEQAQPREDLDGVRRAGRCRVHQRCARARRSPRLGRCLDEARGTRCGR